MGSANTTTNPIGGVKQQSEGLVEGLVVTVAKKSDKLMQNKVNSTQF